MELTVVTKPGPDGVEIKMDGLAHKHLQTKLEKIEVRVGKPITARAVIEGRSVGFDCTITLHGASELIGKAHGEQPLKAVDAAVDKLTRQYEDEAEKRTGRERARRGSGSIKQAEPF